MPLISLAERHLNWVAISLSTMCLAYFYALDRYLFSSAHFSPIFRLLLDVYDSRTAWLALTICVLAAVWSRPGPIWRLVDFFGNHPYSVALASVMMMGLGTILIYHDYPLSMDEYAAVFQAKIFASGRLVAQLPRNLVDWLVVSGFNGSFLVASPESGRAIGHYWPGFSALLAPFEFLNAPWLCNPTLAGLAIVLIYRITFEISGDRRAAGWALLFTVASGGFVANALSYYSMQAHLTANLLFAALLLKPTHRRALGAGLVGSLALILHNPVPHALFGTTLDRRDGSRARAAPVSAGLDSGLPTRRSPRPGVAHVASRNRHGGSRRGGRARPHRWSFYLAGCDVAEYAGRGARQNVVVDAAVLVHSRTGGPPPPRRQPRGAFADPIRRADLRRIPFRALRSGPRMGLPLFSAGVGRRAHIGRLRH